MLCLLESTAAIFRQSTGYVLITNQARKLKVADPNHAKASLTKQWPATEEANRSLVVREQFARFSWLCLVFILVLWSFLSQIFA